MDLTSLPLISTLVSLTYDGLMAVTSLIAPVSGHASAAVAVALVTLVVRAGLIPLGVASARAEQLRSRLAPRLRGLQKRHRRDPERLQRETMALYRAEGASPFTGCLPVLAQAPVLGLLYTVFIHSSIAGRPNALLDETLLGVPLGASLAGEIVQGTAGAGTAIVFAVIIAVIAAVAEATRRLLPVPTSADGPQVPGGALGALQYTTAVIAAFVPLAAAIYLAVTVVWTLGQRLVLRRRYPLASP